MSREILYQTFWLVEASNQSDSCDPLPLAAVPPSSTQRLRCYKSVYWGQIRLSEPVQTARFKIIIQRVRMKVENQNHPYRPHFSTYFHTVSMYWQNCEQNKQSEKKKNMLMNRHTLLSSHPLSYLLCTVTVLQDITNVHRVGWRQRLPLYHRI